MPRPRSSSTACPKTARGCSGSSNDKREAGSRSGARMGAQRGWEEGGRLPSRRQVLKGKVPVIVSNCGLAEQLPCVAHVLFAHRARRAAHLAALPSRSHEDYPAQDQNFHVSFSKCLPIIKGESPCRQGSSASAHEGRLRRQLDVFTTTSPRRTENAFRSQLASVRTRSQVHCVLFACQVSSLRFEMVQSFVVVATYASRPLTSAT